MGKSEEAKSAKAEKQSSPASTDQSNQNTQANIHLYPDWAAMQAYYGPRVTLPPYYNSAVPSGHSPHPYMWGPPQAMMSPYRAPYAAIYPHGGVYAPPAVSVAANPLSTETPTKLSSGNNDHGLVKKLKGFDALLMKIGNGNGEHEGGAEHKVSQSFDTGASSDGSDGNTSGADQPTRKRSREETTSTDGKTEMNSSPASGKEAATPNKAMGVGVAGVPRRPVLSPGMTTALELRNSSTINAKTITIPSDAWLQDERELKRERRKQSNRESARRSRLRKQAEAEEFARKVESLTSENVMLKSEINRLTESSEKMRAENAALVEKMKNSHVGQTGEIVLSIDDQRNTPPRSTENLLSRVNNNSMSNDRSADEDSNGYEKKPNAGAKLHQLLDTSPRADAVAAG